MFQAELRHRFHLRGVGLHRALPLLRKVLEMIAARSPRQDLAGLVALHPERSGDLLGERRVVGNVAGPTTRASGHPSTRANV